MISYSLLLLCMFLLVSVQPLEFVESFVANPDITFKILIVGNPYVGKSCFLMRLCTNSFGTRYASTIGEKNDPGMKEGSVM